MGKKDFERNNDSTDKCAGATDAVETDLCAQGGIREDFNRSEEDGCKTDATVAATGDTESRDTSLTGTSCLLPKEDEISKSNVDVFPAKKSKNEKKSALRTVTSWTVFAILICACILVAYGNIKYSHPYEIYGNSMLPNYKHSDMIFLGNEEIDYNSVIIFDASEYSDNEITWIKRVVAFGGDSLWINDGYVNVKSKNDSWTITTVEGKAVDKINEKGVLDGATEENPFVVPVGHVFFMGDNRNVSKDCREINSQSINKIIGVVGGNIPEWYAFILRAKETILEKMGCAKP